MGKSLTSVLSPDFCSLTSSQGQVSDFCDIEFIKDKSMSLQPQSPRWCRGGAENVVWDAFFPANSLCLRVKSKGKSLTSVLSPQGQVFELAL